MHISVVRAALHCRLSIHDNTQTESNFFSYVYENIGRYNLEVVFLYITELVTYHSRAQYLNTSLKFPIVDISSGESSKSKICKKKKITFNIY